MQAGPAQIASALYSENPPCQPGSNLDGATWIQKEARKGWLYLNRSDTREHSFRGVI